jgi:hypothetical protein
VFVIVRSGFLLLPPPCPRTCWHGWSEHIPDFIERNVLNTPMATQSLAINERRHLELPESCLFAPTELRIGPALSQNEFSRLGKALASVDQASDLWACDYALAGQNRWGDEGLAVAAAATRLSVGYLKVSARIAERFEPARRFPNMTREHYRGLCCFPVEFTDEWLPTVVEKGFSAKTLRALAVEAFGSDPKAGYSKDKKRQVSIPETLFARLKECSPIPKVAVFIEQILLDFVSNATPEEKERITAALNALPRAAYRARTRRKAKKLKEKPAPEPEIVEPADVRFQLKKFEESKRQTYAERRQEQLTNGAQPVPVKEKKYTSKVRIIFTECRGIPLDSNSKFYPSRFYSQDDADSAAAEYSADRGYICEAFVCEVCSSIPRNLGRRSRETYCKTVWHVRAAKSAPVVTAA